MTTARMITDVEDFITIGCGRCDRWQSPQCSAVIWREGLLALRRICRDVGLSEHVKWAHPCYMHAGRNICIIGAFQGDFRLSFMNPALMTDPDGIMSRQGPNTRVPDTIRFTSAGDVARLEGPLRAYLAEAMGYAERGIVQDLPPRAVDLPDELIAALDSDPELAEAFAALTPGRQKSWVFHLNTTQNPATRFARINKARGKILAGQGALER